MHSAHHLRNVTRGRAMRDPRGARNAIAWNTRGSFNGRRGSYELVVNYKTRKILHFQFRGW